METLDNWHNIINNSRVQLNDFYMPVSNDNQDYNNPENKKEGENKSTIGEGKQNPNSSPEANNQMTSDNLKGKKVDADLENDADKPADV